MMLEEFPRPACASKATANALTTDRHRQANLSSGIRAMWLLAGPGAAGQVEPTASALVATIR